MLVCRINTASLFNSALNHLATLNVSLCIGSSEKEDDGQKLKWVKSSSPPTDAVSCEEKSGKILYIAREADTCYPCFYDTATKKCMAKELNDEKEYPRMSRDFEFLVNEDNFELFEWAPSSGNIPPMSFDMSCNGKKNDNVYIGRSDTGFGIFYGPKKRNALIQLFKKSNNQQQFEVLILNNDIKENIIYEVQYNMKNEDKLTHTTFEQYTVENGECEPIDQEAFLEKSGQTSENVATSHMFKGEGKVTVQGKVPLLAEIGGELSLGYERTKSSGNSTTETLANSVKILLKVPPNKSCSIVFTATVFSAAVPFNAKLKRIYTNNVVHETSISGTYFVQKVGKFKGTIERCQPLKNQAPCK